MADIYVKYKLHSFYSLSRHNSISIKAVFFNISPVRWKDGIGSRGFYYGLLNSLVNPILYIFLNASLKAKIVDLFRFRRVIKILLPPMSSGASQK